MCGLKSTSVGLNAAKVKPPGFSNCCTSLFNFSAAAFQVSAPTLELSDGGNELSNTETARNTSSAFGEGHWPSDVRPTQEYVGLVHHRRHHNHSLARAALTDQIQCGLPLTNVEQ